MWSRRSSVALKRHDWSLQQPLLIYDYSAHDLDHVFQLHWWAAQGVISVFKGPVNTGTSSANLQMPYRPGYQSLQKQEILQQEHDKVVLMQGSLQDGVWCFTDLHDSLQCRVCSESSVLVCEIWGLKSFWEREHHDALRGSVTLALTGCLLL